MRSCDGPCWKATCTPDWPSTGLRHPPGLISTALQNKSVSTYQHLSQTPCSLMHCTEVINPHCSYTSLPSLALTGHFGIAAAGSAGFQAINSGRRGRRRGGQAPCLLSLLLANRGLQAAAACLRAGLHSTSVCIISKAPLPTSRAFQSMKHNGGGSQGGWPPWMHNCMQPITQCASTHCKRA